MIPTMHLLEAGVPLTLLLDLSAPAGPDSRAIYRAEGRRPVATHRPRRAAAPVPAPCG